MQSFLIFLSCVLSANAAPSALTRARQLTPPKPVQTVGGEFEGAEFWEKNDALLKAAWREYGSKHEALYRFDEGFESLYIAPEMQRAVHEARQGPSHSEMSVQALFSTVAPNVTSTTQLFTPLFTRHLLEELDHLAQSGIPQRRPNGMNRYGAILGDLGLDGMLSGLVAKYLAPLGALQYPHAAIHRDIDHHFAFMVRYQQGEDVSLEEHADASVITMNLCLGREFEGGELEFAPLSLWGKDRMDTAAHARSTEGRRQ